MANGCMYPQDLRCTVKELMWKLIENRTYMRIKRHFAQDVEKS